ncbi:DUF362 domain-containing protein [candidate division KSB1 bacterium]|nr:DUF362 domain-containing protein [candidate division KSB1 bacterium]RQW00563.1 MAG: DUF362 domain-containing protein [candidate division KSB1 bacterium]
MQQFTRRQFVTTATLATAGSLFPAQSNDTRARVAVVRNGEPPELVRQAIDMLGGISHFVQPGQSVLIKPNMSWDRLPEQAATTNPEAVAEVVRLCKQAGARLIRIVDRTCNRAERCYYRSGIEKAATAAGAQVRHVVPSRFVDTTIPNGSLLSTWPVYKDVLDVDVLINMPIAKHHTIPGVTLGMKNIMGLIGGDRGDLHVDFDVKITDLNTIIRPALTLVDAYRILRRNGPSGGSLEDVEEKRMVIAGIDPVATDARAVQLFGLEPDKIAYLVQAHKRGLGEVDLTKVAVHDYSF